MKNSTRYIVGSAIGSVFTALALGTGVMALGDHEIKANDKAINTEEQRLAREFVRDKILQEFPMLVPHQNFLVDRAKSFIKENKSVICNIRSKDQCTIDEVHKPALLREVIVEAIVATYLDDHLENIRKDLEDALKNDPTANGGPADVPRSEPDTQIQYKDVRARGFSL